MWCYEWALANGQVYVQDTTEAGMGAASLALSKSFYNAGNSPVVNGAALTWNGNTWINNQVGSFQVSDNSIQMLGCLVRDTMLYATPVVTLNLAAGSPLVQGPVIRHPCNETHYLLNSNSFGVFNYDHAVTSYTIEKTLLGIAVSSNKLYFLAADGLNYFDGSQLKNLGLTGNSIKGTNQCGYDNFYIWSGVNFQIVSSTSAVFTLSSPLI